MRKKKSTRKIFENQEKKETYKKRRKSVYSTFIRREMT